MRLSLLGAGAALAAGLALSACSGGTGSSSVPSSGAQAQTMSHGHKLVTRLMPGVKPLTGIGCDYSKYSFCFYVTPGDAGPYVSTSDDTAPLYNVGYIEKNKNGKVDKKFDTYFYPDPGDPTSQYIDYKHKVKKTGTVKFTDVYCISFTQYGCAEGSGSILYLGIALTP
ncbi:MAG: hypothetical protein ABSD52_11710 [Candidatus Cybelea sp.]